MSDSQIKRVLQIDMDDWMWHYTNGELVHENHEWYDGLPYYLEKAQPFMFRTIYLYDAEVRELFERFGLTERPGSRTIPNRLPEGLFDMLWKQGQ